jgi:hypothetical protein
MAKRDGNWGGRFPFFYKTEGPRHRRTQKGGCYEREKQRGEGKQEGATEKPQREEKDEEGEEKQVGWGAAKQGCNPFLYWARTI